MGIRLDLVNRAAALAQARMFLNQPGQYRIYTPNPEMIVLAQQDEQFREVLNRGDLNLCDGVGLYWAARFQGVRGLQRITGTDFMLDLCRLAAEQGRGIYLLGSGSREVVSRTAGRLQQMFANLRMVGFNPGPAVDAKGEVAEAEARILINEIKQKQPEILLVAFGMGKQEKWIDRNLGALPSVKIAMGVGGAFDYLGGRVGRAPGLLRKLGLEWLYRLIREPWRARRIFNATARFVYLYIKRS